MTHNNGLAQRVKFFGSQSMTKVQELWKRVGIFTRFLTYTSIIIFLVSIGLDTSKLFGNYANNTILSLHLYTIFTAPLANVSLLGLIVGLYAYIPEGSTHERECGTLPYFLDFAYLNIQIQLIFTMIGFFAYLLFESTSIRLYSVGLYPIYVVYQMSKTLRAPTVPHDVLFFPLEIKGRYLPYFLAAFFMILDGGLRLDLLIALLVGVLHRFGLMPQLTVSKEVLQSIERHRIFKWCVSNGNFISVDYIEPALRSSIHSPSALSATNQQDGHLLASHTTGHTIPHATSEMKIEVSPISDPSDLLSSGQTGGSALLDAPLTGSSQDRSSNGLAGKNHTENTRDDSLLNNVDQQHPVNSSKSVEIEGLEKYDQLSGDDDLTLKKPGVSQAL